MKMNNLKKLVTPLLLFSLFSCKENSNNELHSVYLANKESEGYYVLALSFPGRVTLTKEEVARLKDQYKNGDLESAITLAYHYTKNGPQTDKAFWVTEANRRFNLPPKWELVLDEPQYLNTHLGGENILKTETH